MSRRCLGSAEKGLQECFRLFTEKRLRQIIKAAKLQGQTLAATRQNLNRLYEMKKECLAVWNNHPKKDNNF